MTPPIDPVEETSIEKDAETVRLALHGFIRTVERAPAREAFARILAELEAAKEDGRRWQEALGRYTKELTLEKQRGEALRAALDRAGLALAKVQPAIDTACGWALNIVPDAEREIGEALRISQGEA